MNNVITYQDLLDRDHAALVAECKRIDRALALGVDPYAKTLDSMPRLAIKRLAIAAGDNPYAVLTR